MFSFGVLLYELLAREITAAAVLATARAGDSEICELYAHKARDPARPAQLAAEPDSAQSRPNAVAHGAAPLGSAPAFALYRTLLCLAFLSPPGCDTSLILSAPQRLQLPLKQ